MQLDLWKSIMFKSSRKKLIAAGCSFTEHNLFSSQSPNVDFDFPRWPEHLSNMLDMECVNIGHCGAGNDQILARTLDVVLKEKNIGFVVVMWSEWQRIGFQRYKDRNIWHQVTPHEPHKDYSLSLFELQTPRHATRNALRTFIHAEKILKDIPYMFIQGTHGINYYEFEKPKNIYSSKYTPDENMIYSKSHNSLKLTAEEMFACHDYFDYIENNIGNKFIGWPIMRELGGYCISEILDKEDPTRLKYRISEDDTHPNAAGHKVIAEFLYEQYKEIYNEN